MAILMILEENLRATQQEIERAEHELGASRAGLALRMTLDSLYDREETLKERLEGYKV